MPIVVDLDAAMMQPAVSVPAVRRLGGGSIRLNDASRPLRETGRDAVVYELRSPVGRILALRCFLTADPHRDATLQTRYVALRDDPRLAHLKAGDGPLPGEIQWISEGIALPGPDLHRVTAPLISMERVPGRTLIRAVDRLCREEQTGPIALLADAWLDTAIALERIEFTHGDLAADNLVVRPNGTIALVDLDTAIWPSADLPHTSPSGSPSYTHPHGATIDPARQDRFPTFMIWAALRILARHPELRQRWGDPPDQHGAALLWSRDDLRRPGHSPLLSALDDLDDESLRPLLEIVRRAIKFSPDETPPLAEIANRLDGLGLPRLASSHVLPSRRGSVQKPRELTERATDSRHAPAHPAHAGDKDATPDNDAVSTPISKRSGRHPDASRTTTRVERDRRWAAAHELGAAVAARDTVTAVRLWDASRSIPEAASYAAGVHHLVSQEFSVMIDRAIRRHDDAGLVAAIADAERAGVAPSREARSASRLARQRLAARTSLNDALEQGDLEAIAELKLSGKLDPLGRLEPVQARAVSRALAWPALERALVSDDDAAIIAAADPAVWRQHEAMPAGVWQRLDNARVRLHWVQDVRAALRRRDTPALGGLLSGAPPGAEKLLTEVESRRVLRVTMREAAVGRLERALREGPDREVVAALAEFESAGAPFSDVLDWTAVRGVVDRITLAEAIREATTAVPPDTTRLARLLPAARAALGDSGTGGGPDWIALERSVLRAAHLTRLREALSTNNDGRIVSAASPDPYGAIEMLRPDERERVRQALSRGESPGRTPI
jgi:hypothetical protein